MNRKMKNTVVQSFIFYLFLNIDASIILLSVLLYYCFGGWSCIRSVKSFASKLLGILSWRLMYVHRVQPKVSYGYKEFWHIQRVCLGKRWLEVVNREYIKLQSRINRTFSHSFVKPLLALYNLLQKTLWHLNWFLSRVVNWFGQYLIDVCSKCMAGTCQAVNDTILHRRCRLLVLIIWRMRSWKDIVKRKVWSYFYVLYMCVLYVVAK